MLNLFLLLESSSITKVLHPHLHFPPHASQPCGKPPASSPSLPNETCCHVKAFPHLLPRYWLNVSDLNVLKSANYSRSILASLGKHAQFLIKGNARKGSICIQMQTIVLCFKNSSQSRSVVGRIYSAMNSPGSRNKAWGTDNCKNWPTETLKEIFF